MIQKQHEGQRRAPQSDDLAFEVCQSEAQVSQGDGVPFGHEVPSSEPVSTFSVILDRMSSPRLPSTGWRWPAGAAQVDLVAHELKDLLPAGDEARAEHVAMLKGLLGEAAGDDLLPICFSCMPAFSLSRSHCPASLRRIWQVRQRNKVMGKIKLFPTAEYSSKQPSDPVVPLGPCTGIFLGPSKSGKTVAVMSMILEQYCGVFEKIYIFSPSINIDDG